MKNAEKFEKELLKIDFKTRSTYLVHKTSTKIYKGLVCYGVWNLTLGMHIIEGIKDLAELGLASVNWILDDSDEITKEDIANMYYEVNKRTRKGGSNEHDN